MKTWILYGLAKNKSKQGDNDYDKILLPNFFQLSRNTIHHASFCTHEQSEIKLGMLDFASQRFFHIKIFHAVFFLSLCVLCVDVKLKV